MPASTAQSDAAFFDHEHHTASDGPGRRRRPAPDWGGDDLFDHVPRRRFEREEGRVPADIAAHAVADLAPVVPLRPGRTAAIAVAEPVGAAADAPRDAPAPYDPFPLINGRRTVTVTGHPGYAARVERRPARTVESRLHARPDQLAGWAFALGLLLIVMAVVTSG